jgi:hypothetical protein
MATRNSGRRKPSRVGAVARRVGRAALGAAAGYGIYRGLKSKKFRSAGLKVRRAVTKAKLLIKSRVRHNSAVRVFTKKGYSKTVVKRLANHETYPIRLAAKRVGKATTRPRKVGILRRRVSVAPKRFKMVTKRRR